MTAVVRRAEPSDWATFGDLRLRALLDSPDAFGSTYADEVGRDEAGWRAWLEIEAPKMLAFHDGEAVAIGGVYVTDDDIARIITMWTAPEHRGHGHGRAILAELVAWAQAVGHPVDLHVNTTNPSALKVYEDFGFVATGQIAPLRPGSDQTIERLILSNEGRARLTDESITMAIRRALEERIESVRRRTTPRRDLNDIIARGRSRPTLDPRGEDEILGYGPDGLPS